jgi:uncharacterized protein (DUF2236 family)
MQGAIKRVLAERVRAIFNDGGNGEKPVERHSDGLFGPRSVAWRVHGDVTTMMVGGVSALLLQMLHPRVLAGVWDHSNFRNDMHGRLRRTARFIALTTYGSREQAEAAIGTVRRIHRSVRGRLPDGTAYSAQDPELLTWVHATETLSFLNAWIRYAEPLMRLPDQDRYFSEAAIVARGLGAEAVPMTRDETIRYIQSMRPQLQADQRTRDVAELILASSDRKVEAVPGELVRRAAVDLLPVWARQMHGFRSSGITRPLVTGGTLALAQTLRWAFR